jgi:hypothetical protein
MWTFSGLVRLEIARMCGLQTVLLPVVYLRADLWLTIPTTQA